MFWKFDHKTRLTPDYAFKIVNKSDDHPVRFGKQSIRQQIRRGDYPVKILVDMMIVQYGRKILECHLRDTS